MWKKVQVGGHVYIQTYLSQLLIVNTIIFLLILQEENGQ